MFWRILLLASGATYVASNNISILPDFNDVLVNSSLELACYCSNYTTNTTWVSTQDINKFSRLIFSPEGECKTEGFLADDQYFETSCYSNGTFKVNIKHVNITYHGQGWHCMDEYITSNRAYIRVKVPIRYLRIVNMSGNVIQALENFKTTITCKTSEGRPVANISWIKESKRGIKTELTKYATFSISTQENDMEIVQSSIDLIPLKADNDTRIICQATNKISNMIKTEITLYVQYPPSKPYFHFLPRNKFARSGELLKHKLIIEEGSNFTVMCRSDGDPPPTSRWNITNDTTESPNLTFTNITKNDKGIYKCVAENLIQRSFPKYERKHNNSTDLEIDVQYKSRIVKFYVTEFEKRDHYVATENESIFFNCYVDCNPKSSISISFKSKELGRNVSTRGLVLPHKVISCFDDGVYICSAHNIYNKEPCFKELTLRVKCTPLLSPEFDLKDNITSTQTGTVTFAFKTIAFPIPQYQWFKFSDTSWTKLTNCKKFQIKINGLYSCLTISDIIIDDFGIYKLRINNEVGDLEQLYFLKDNDSLSVSTKLAIDSKYFIYTIGGIMFIVASLVGTCFIFKRQKQQCTKRAFDQNVSIEVHEAENIYQNMPINRINEMHETKYVCHYKKPVVCKIQENTTEVRESGISRNLQEFDNIMLEAPAYCNIQQTIDNLEHIKISEILDYILIRTDESVRAEFQKIPTVFQLPCSFAHNPKNLSQNRYRDVVPYDNTRVVIDNEPAFYINASYIDGYKKPNAYIACLGPTSKTHDNFKSFWKMVWHMNVEIIVMLTNLNEPSGMKCEQYWPDVNESEMYGDEHVFCQELHEFAEYTIRKFEVSSNKDRVHQTACRRIVQLHYTAWPDKKTPEDVVTLLEFRHKFRNIDNTLNGPVIIHCSAGIGRTGVFIAIDRLIMEGHSEGTVNVAVCVKKMREMRMRMVQTAEQYKFIFKALAYALYFDSEPIQTENIIEKIEGADDTLFDIKYQELLMSLENTGNDITSTAAVYENVMLKDIHTDESLDNNNRVHLYLNRGYGDSDYINAVYINSFKLKDHLIMAQSPLPGTEFDFLTMIYQENCSCIVSIEDISEQSMTVNKCFPTNNCSIDIGCFTVCCSVHNSNSQYTVSKMTIQNKEKFSDGGRDFYHFQYKNWKAKYVIPERAEEFVEFVKYVEEFVTHTNESSHVLVHCLNGSDRSGIYCAVAIIMENILYDKKVSVLNTLRHLRTRRPNAITSMEQMKFCFKAAKTIAETQIKTSGISNDTPCGTEKQITTKTT